jgi:asparagine synthase (glutamine-hydrolysing)
VATLAGAWGTRAGELLAGAANGVTKSTYQIGRLAMYGLPHLQSDGWSCWLFGEPLFREELLTRYGDGAHRWTPNALSRAFADRGMDACELLYGRFVLVAYDRASERCLITRDQLGAQPVVYASMPGGVLFAEHERDLLGLLARTPEPDRLALLQWIENGITPQGRTLYEGVRRLPAGHRIVCHGDRTRVERWWMLRYQGVEDGSRAELAEQVRDAAFSAVGRAAADSKRAAVKLSGGLDSACVAAALTANGFADGRTKAIGGTFADHPASDERGLIEATAHHAHLPLEQVAFDPAGSMLAPALAHIERWRLPPATPNLFLWQPLMSRARELSVDLMLDGEGGDELFGLAPYLIDDVLRAGKLDEAWVLSGRVPGIGQSSNRDVRWRVLRHYGIRPLVPLAVRRRRETARAESPGAIIPLADARALVELRFAREAERRDGPAWWRFQAESLIDTRDLLDMGSHFRREAVDEAIDVRHPFLFDLQLIEAMLRVPPRAQFDPVRDRPLLRDGLKDLIPEAVRTRYAKSNFSALVLAGIRSEEASLVEPLRQANAPVREYVEPSALDRKLAISADRRPLLGAGSLWRVAIIDRWLSMQTARSS